jgi:hypothetical protein
MRRLLRHFYGLLVSVALPCIATPVFAADPTQPHYNQGIAPRLNGRPVGVTLSGQDRSSLAEGSPIQKTVLYDGGGRGVAVQWVSASVADVWTVILSFGRYPQWVDGVKSCTVYGRSGAHWYVDFVIGKFGVTRQYYIDHTFNRSQGYLSWTLDYSRLSDFDDSVGYWLVTPITTDPPVTQVEYSVDLRLTNAPDVFVKYLNHQALEGATSWVKTQAEARAAAP